MICLCDNDNIVQIQHDSTVNAEEAAATLIAINEAFSKLEQKAGQLEQQISEMKDSKAQVTLKSLLNTWFELAQEKMNLLRKQSECVFL